MRWVLTLLALSVAACGPTAEEEAERQEAIAKVQAGLEPPVEQLELDPIRYPEIEKHDLYGAGCSFAPDGGGISAVAIAMADEGYLISEGELLRFAADAGSRELPYLAREKYTGREYAFTLKLDDTEGEQSGEETTDYRGTLNVRDGMDRTVYEATGLVQCGA